MPRVPAALNADLVHMFLIQSTMVAIWLIISETSAGIPLNVLISLMSPLLIFSGVVSGFLEYMSIWISAVIVFACSWHLRSEQTVGAFSRWFLCVTVYWVTRATTWYLVGMLT